MTRGPGRQTSARSAAGGSCLRWLPPATAVEELRITRTQPPPYFVISCASLTDPATQPALEEGGFCPHLLQQFLSPALHPCSLFPFRWFFSGLSVSFRAIYPFTLASHRGHDFSGFPGLLLASGAYLSPPSAESADAALHNGVQYAACITGSTGAGRAWSSQYRADLTTGSRGPSTSVGAEGTLLCDPSEKHGWGNVPSSPRPVLLHMLSIALSLSGAYLCSIFHPDLACKYLLQSAVDFGSP